MFNELLKNVMNLGIITEDDVKRLTAIELMLLIIERSNGLLQYLTSHIQDSDNRFIALDKKYQQITEDIKKQIIDNETYFNEVIVDNLQDIAIDQLNSWLTNGTLEDLINETALANISNRVSALEEWKTTYIDETNKATKLLARNVDFSSKNFRIPWMTVTNQGTIIAGSDVRYNNAGDQSFIDLGYKRSTDGGQTWSEPKIAIRNKRVDATYSRVMDGTILCDPYDNKIYLLGNSFESSAGNWTQSTESKDSDWDVLLAVSTDDGETFEEPISLRHLGGSGISMWIGGVGTGIVMSNGTLVFPIQVSFVDKVRTGSYNTKSGIIYSSNHGTTWQMSTSFVDAPSSECTIVEYDNKLILNARSDGNKNRRIFYTTDLGASWVAMRELSENTAQYNACQGHMIKLPYKDNRQEECVLFSHPTGNARNALGVSVLNARMSRFTSLGVVYPWGFDGYNCLAYDIIRDRLYCLYEAGDIYFEDISYLLKYCNKEFTEDIIQPKFKAVIPISERRQKIGIYVTGSKYGSNENDGLTLDKGWKDLSRLNELSESTCVSITIIIHPEYDGKLMIENIKQDVEIKGMDGYRIPCRGLYFRNTGMVKIPWGLDVIEPFSVDYLMAFENTSVGFTRVNIKPSIDFKELMFVDDARVTMANITFKPELLGEEESATTTTHNSIAFFQSRPSDVALAFTDDTNFQSFYNLFRINGDQGTSTNRITINNIQSVKDMAVGAFFVNLSTTGSAIRVTELAPGLGETSSGMPSLFVRNSNVYVEADIQIQDFSQIQSGSTVLFTVPPIMRPSSKRRILGYVARLNLGVVEESYSVIIEINPNGQVKMIGRPETNNLNALEIFGSYSLA